MDDPQDDPRRDPLVGKTLDGRYQIERVLGEGGMGVVYAARHTALNKALAVKVLRAEVSKDQDIVARFRQEAQSASSIGNEHIIDISDFGSLPDGSTYFVMEFLDGISLTTLLEKTRPLPPSRTVHIAKQLCSALGAAHERGIVHRDLKPDNIYLIKRSGDPDFVKVLDFGIAKVGGATSKLTKAGQVFGTPHYMSPEQCGGTEIDQRTDIYALGVILYEMASGRVPFDADNLMGILTKHLYEQPIPVRELPPPAGDIPAPVEAVIMKCLAKKPDQRYQSMHEMREDLERIEQGLTPNAIREAVERTSTGGMSRESGVLSGVAVGTEEFAIAKKSRMPLVVAVAALLLIGGGGLAFALFGGSEKGTPEDHPSVTAQLPPLPPTETAPPPPPAHETTPPPPTEAPVVMLTLTSEPVGAEVYKGDLLLGNTPFEIPRPSGEDLVEISLRFLGYKDQNVRLSSLTQPNVRIALERETSGSSGGGGSHTKHPHRNEPPATPSTDVHTPPPPPEEPRHTGPQSEVLDPWGGRN